MKNFEKETLEEIESLYDWAYGSAGSRRLSKQNAQYVLSEFRKLAKRYKELKGASADVENGREATIEDHSK
ncbi:hypothetical protein AT278_14185 [Bacillus cereus]|uniref:hypothetical protein n=1 Tax=Bacillus TaxID=1386 RepID=UPI00077A0EBD|nr:hypothetical protein [Bacillus cereus]KXY57121.1 hypothetical protein AT278_14185 [Bacillus cereus]PGM73037.1 hypothetical protein CN952_10760 [Bacillus cereus]PGN06950.1 hypothetical protein CN954_24030 [Bacillus cereus]HDR4868828.1 hypothetical protein [Bacillus cereus]HDR4880346.1 hypothetical protein [Bacillus cereus]